MGEEKKTEETTNGDAEKSENGHKNGDAKNGDSENGHKNGDAKNGDSTNGEHKNGDAENGKETTEEAKENGDDAEKEAPKRKAEEDKPESIPVSAEKIAKLTENKDETETA